MIYNNKHCYIRKEVYKMAEKQYETSNFYYAIVHTISKP